MPTTTPVQKLIISRKGATQQILDLVLTGRLFGLRLASHELTASGALNPDCPLTKLNHATVAIVATLAAPVEGDLVIITDSSASGTAAHTVTLPDGVTWDGTNDVATFNAPGETLVAVALSATRFLILLNIGAVGLST